MVRLTIKIEPNRIVEMVKKTNRIVEMVKEYSSQLPHMACLLLDQSLQVLRCFAGTITIVVVSIIYYDGPTQTPYYNNNMSTLLII